MSKHHVVVPTSVACCGLTRILRSAGAAIMPALEAVIIALGCQGCASVSVPMQVSDGRWLVVAEGTKYTDTAETEVELVRQTAIHHCRTAEGREMKVDQLQRTEAVPPHKRNGPWVKPAARLFFKCVPPSELAAESPRSDPAISLHRPEPANPAATTTQLGRKVKMVVLPFRPVAGVSRDTCYLLSSLLLAELDRFDGLKTISKEDIDAMLDVERQKDLLGCETSACAAEIGGALGADVVLRADVGVIGTSYALNVTVIDTKASTVAGRASKIVPKDDDNLAPAMPILAAEIVARLNR